MPESFCRLSNINNQFNVFATNLDSEILKLLFSLFFNLIYWTCAISLFIVYTDLDCCCNSTYSYVGVLDRTDIDCGMHSLQQLL